MATRACPECGSQYVASVRTCIDCDVALVDEVDPTAPERAPAPPKSDGEQVAYELPGWGNPLKVSLEGMLDRAGIRRAWESGALVVPAEFEEEVDRLVATVEGGDVDLLDDDAPQIAFEIEGLGPDELADLDARLIAAHLAHAWDDKGALLVTETDEDEVADLIDQVLASPSEEDEVDGMAVQQALSALYVAVDKLMKDPDDDKDRSRFLDASAALDGMAVPYGLSGVDWAQLIGDVEALAEAVRPPGDAADADGHGAESTDDHEVADDSGDGGSAALDEAEPEADGGKADDHAESARVADADGVELDDEADADASSGPSVADQARFLRGRLHELV